jgi:hypothetical protein
LVSGLHWMERQGPQMMGIIIMDAWWREIINMADHPW